MNKVLFVFHDKEIVNGKEFRLKITHDTIQEAAQYKSLTSLLKIKAPIRRRAKLALQHDMITYIEYEEHTIETKKWLIYYAIKYKHIPIALSLYELNVVEYNVYIYLALKSIKQDDNYKAYKDQVMNLFKNVKNVSDSIGIRYCGSYIQTSTVKSKQEKQIQELIKHATIDILKQELTNSLGSYLNTGIMCYAYKVGRPEFVSVLYDTITQNKFNIAPPETIRLFYHVVMKNVKSLRELLNNVPFKSTVVRIAFEYACKLDYNECLDLIVQNIYHHKLEYEYREIEVCACIGLQYLKMDHVKSLVKILDKKGKRRAQQSFMNFDCRDMIDTHWDQYTRKDLFSWACTSGNMYVLRRIANECIQEQTKRQKNKKSIDTNAREILHLKNVCFDTYWINESDFENSLISARRYGHWHVLRLVLYSPAFVSLVQDYMTVISNQYNNAVLDNDKRYEHILAPVLL
jgi:hypothetical protein